MSVIRKLAATALATVGAAGALVTGTTGTAVAAPASVQGTCQYAYCLIERGNPHWNESECITIAHLSYSRYYGVHPGYNCYWESDNTWAIYAENGAPMP